MTTEELLKVYENPKVHSLIYRNEEYVSLQQYKMLYLEVKKLANELRSPLADARELKVLQEANKVLNELYQERETELNLSNRLLHDTKERLREAEFVLSIIRGLVKVG